MSPRYHNLKTECSPSTHTWSVVVLCLLAACCQPAHSQQATACGPSYSTPPLSCTANQWVRITAEFYAPRLTGGGASASCQADPPSGCNTALFNTGLQANCNGPVGAEPCRETVDVQDARGRELCLTNVTELAAIVQYSCVKETDVLDLCDTNRQLRSEFSASFQKVYLASPGFPASSTSGQLCSCTLQGSKLRVTAVQVTVVARLPWHDDVTEGSDYEAVLAIRDKGTTLFKSNDCVDCTRVSSMNTILVSTGLHAVSELTITYSDFGLEDQNVWLEITELGPDLNISCTSSSLPVDRTITTTTTSTTTITANTTASPAGASTPPTTAPTARPVTTSSKSTTQRTTTDNGRPSGGGPRKPRNDNSSGSGGSGDSSTVVVLVVVLILLLVLGGILGFILYRRRGQCGADGKRGIKPMVKAWYRDLECCVCLHRFKSRSGDHQDPETVRSGVDNMGFDDAAVASGGLDPAQDTPTRQPVDSTSGDGDVHHPRYNKHQPRRKHVTTVHTEDGELTITQNQVYQSHREMVEGEVARMRQNKRDQRAQDGRETMGSNGTLDQQLPPDTLKKKGTIDKTWSPDQLVEEATRLDNQPSKLGGNTRSPGRFAQSLESPDQNYAEIRDYEPMQQKLSSESSDETIVQDDTYIYTQTDKSPTSHRKQKDNQYANKTDQPSSRYIHPLPEVLHSTHNTSVESSDRVEQANNVDHKALSQTRDLLSPEERNMFAALGLSGGTLDSNQNMATSDPHSQQPEEADYEYLSPQFTTQSGATENSNGSSETPEEPYSSVKPKRAPKPEIVADILELSLKNIKGQRREQGSDESSGGAEKDEVFLGSRENDFQMSEC